MRKHSHYLTVAAVFVIAIFVSGPLLAQRTNVARNFPLYDNAGRPDLVMDPQRFTSQMEIVDRYFDPVADECAFAEGAIGSSRR